MAAITSNVFDGLWNTVIVNSIAWISISGSGTCVRFCGYDRRVSDFVFEHLGGGRCTLDVNGDVVSGQLHQSDNNTISWGDGDVWVRKKGFRLPGGQVVADAPSIRMRAVVANRRPTPCATLGCPFAATWHPTHCCARCARERLHGKRCERKRVAESDAPSPEPDVPSPQTRPRLGMSVRELNSRLGQRRFASS